MPPKITTAAGRSALAAYRRDPESATRAEAGTAVRYLLQLLAEKAPGGTIEVRVPPYGAVQVGDGPSHTRGTPPNVVETDPQTWVALAVGELTWTDAMGGGSVRASGVRADLSRMLPLRP